MDFNTALYGFMNMIREDPRLGPSHISLYLAILYYYKQQNYHSPISIYSRELKKQARIAAAGTYHKCMQDLEESGYIQYLPSYNPVLGSLIYLTKIES